MLDISCLTKTFRLSDSNVQALRGVALSLAPGEFFVLLGPSGCGKTTMLRAVAGLEKPDDGQISIEGTTVFDARRRLYVPPEQRPIAMVFQSYAVWPHMDVYENIAFPLREGVRRLPLQDIDDRVQSVLTLLGLEDMADRAVTTLSGGQQQRVALARALALRPKILLMDEPLSNLDLKLQMRLRSEIKGLMRQLGLTTLYVTHNQSEALEMGDRIAVMDRGRIVQIGRPEELYRSPNHEFVARFVGDMNLLEGRIVGQGASQLTVATGATSFLIPAPSEHGFREGERCFAGIRPEDVRISRDKTPSAFNCARGTVQDIRFVGDGYMYVCRTGGDEVVAKAHRSIDIERGEDVYIEFPSEYCLAIGADETNAPPDAVMMGEGAGAYRKEVAG